MPLKILVSAFCLLAAFASGSTDPTTFTFTYQSNLEPFPSYECEHKQASIGLFEWDVTCDLGKKGKKFYMVHLVANRHPNSPFGGSAYEILYWATDATNPFSYKDQSVTLWIHNPDKEGKIGVLEASLGVDNDNAYLKLWLHPG